LIPLCAWGEGVGEVVPQVLDVLASHAQPQEPRRRPFPTRTRRRRRPPARPGPLPAPPIRACRPAATRAVCGAALATGPQGREIGLPSDLLLPSWRLRPPGLIVLQRALTWERG
jgi:hypothetical protein